MRAFNFRGEVIYPPTPRPTPKLENINYIFKRWDVNVTEDESTGLDLFVNLIVRAAGHGVPVPSWARVSWTRSS